MSANQKKISKTHHQAGKFVRDSGFGIVTYLRDGRLGPRWQANYQLVVLHRGSVTLLVDGVSIEVKAGMGVLLAPGHVEEFHFSSNVEARHSWCQVPPGELPDSMRFPGFAFHRATKCPPRTLALIRLGLSAGEGNLPDPRQASSLVIAAMWAFVSAIEWENAAQNVDLGASALGRFHAAVESLGTKAITLKDLAGQAGVSSGHLIKLVRERLGMTPMEAVWRSRVTRAAKLLSETGLSVAEVAHHTGFANAYHFSRRFRRQFGQSPRAWRVANWGMR